MYQTQTITRRTIKRVENRLNGIRGLAGITVPYPASTPPINGTSTNGSISFSDFWNFINGSLGQLKIEATQFAEGMNRLLYGMEPGCTNPVPNIPVVPNNQTPRFCASSVAGMIERCRTNEASSGLSSINTQFQQRMSNSSDPAAPYIKRWWDQYGQNNISTLTAIIANARGTCGVIGDVPKLCTSPQSWCAGLLKCTAPGECPTGSGGSTQTIVMFAILGFAAMMMLKR